MARVRFLKPGFFENAKLAKISPHGRLLFAGLWTIADKRGRLRDNVKSIAGAIFPHENVNVDRLLKDLANGGFIQRYEVDEERFIQVVNFEKHQSPHYKEAESRLPPPSLTGQSPSKSLRHDLGLSRADYGQSDYGQSDYGQSDYGQSDNRIPEHGRAKPKAPPPLEPTEQKNIYREAERAFNRPLSPVECDSLREIEVDYPEETWRYALRESAELNKKSIRYVQSVCRRVASGEDSHEDRNTHTDPAGGPAAGSYPTDGTPAPAERVYVSNPNRGRDGP